MIVENGNGKKLSRHEIRRSGGKTKHGLVRAASSKLSALQDVNGDDGAIYYDRRAASVLAEIASWAYASCEVLLDELHHSGVVDEGATCTQVSVENDAMLVVSTAFLIRSGRVGVISFRGTEPTSAINFLADASIKPLDLLSLGQVHGGFYRNVRAVWTELEEQIQAAVDSAEEPLEAIYITGHSLGAAMAVIAAAIIFANEDYEKWRGIVRGVYTYGQPMVGDKEFARSCGRFEKLLFRHVYGKDLVARLPPRTTGHFAHFGVEYHGSETGWRPRTKLTTQLVSIAVSLPIGFAAWALKQIPLLGWVRLPLSIDDHSPNSYLQAFRAAES